LWFEKNLEKDHEDMTQNPTGVKSNPKQSSCRKKCAASKNAVVKKDLKFKVAAKKWM